MGRTQEYDNDDDDDDEDLQSADMSILQQHAHSPFECREKESQVPVTRFLLARNLCFRCSLLFHMWSWFPVDSNKVMRICPINSTDCLRDSLKTMFFLHTEDWQNALSRSVINTRSSTVGELFWNILMHERLPFILTDHHRRPLSALVIIIAHITIRGEGGSLGPHKSSS